MSCGGSWTAASLEDSGCVLSLRSVCVGGERGWREYMERQACHVGDLFSSHCSQEAEPAPASTRVLVHAEEPDAGAEVDSCGLGGTSNSW